MANAKLHFVEMLSLVVKMVKVLQTAGLDLERRTVAEWVRSIEAVMD